MNNADNGLHHEEEKQQFWRKPAIRQSFVVLGLMSLMFSAGVGMGTATVMLPQLKKNNDEIPVDEAMSSWIYSGHGFGSIPAVLTVPYLCNKKGYTFIFKFICIPMIASFLLQYFATNAVYLLVVAICQGMTMGGNISLGIIAITEYAEPRLRGLFLVIKSASYFWGIWIANIMGTFSYWRYIPLFGIWPALFSLASCFAWPDGPYWLASVGRIEDCKKSFAWLRGPGNSDEEISCFIKRSNHKSHCTRKTDLITRIKETVVLRQFYMPFIINCVLYSLYYFTAKMVVTVYALVIIKEITKNESIAYTGMLIIDGVTVLGMYIGSYVAMKVKRRLMFLYTSGATILLLYILCAYLSLVVYKFVAQNSLVSLSLLVIYSFCVSWGPMILSTSFTSEITPMRFKSFIISVSSVIFWLLHSATLKLAPLLFKTIGMHGSFGIYGTLTLICWIFLYKYLPETSNKTLKELEYCFVEKMDRNAKEDETILGNV